MKMLGSFAEKAPNRVFLSVVLGALAGAAYAAIIPIALAAIAPDSGQFTTVGSETGWLGPWQVSHHRFAVLFAVVCGFILLARTVSQVILVRISMDVTTDLRTKMYRRIANAPIADLERVGLPRLIASITSDVPVIITGARMLPDLLTNAVTLVGMLGFLLYLNAAVFWFVMGCIGFGIVTYQVPMLVARGYLNRSRRHLDDLHESVRGLVHGAKELKLNSRKREEYFRTVLAQAEREVRDSNKTGYTIMRIAQNYGDLIAFFVIGAIAFVFVNYNAISAQELNGVVMVLLYVTAPVAVLLNFIPQYAAAQVALRKVNQLFGQIPEEAVAPDATARAWETMRLVEVGYRYAGHGGEAGFAVGPIDLELRKGEIVFIVGGNGSGKSTLSKLLTLHYLPAEGTIEFDGEAVGPANITAWRAGICAIYSDYHLFDRALGLEGRDVQADVEGYLRALGLDHKVKLAGGRYSTLSLSDGQRRRLALVAALLEDAQLYLFDEWAADQDPAFKAVFYHQILPDLRARGKAVVVISHDDRYFHLADRMVVVNEGRIASDQRPAPGAGHAPMPAPPPGAPASQAPSRLAPVAADA
jgi:putative ATP-binding cassette transporter